MIDLCLRRVLVVVLLLALLQYVQCVSSHYYMCVLLLLYMCPYTCVLILIGEPVERLSLFLVLKLSKNST